tara:strand:+ start:55 stop:489 length:435 start_codon:yes stop_codon:yes gene_type:complete
MTTIFFPILTFAMVFLLGIVIGIYISSQIENHIDKSIQKVSSKYFTYKDQNGNTLKSPVQNHTLENHVSLMDIPKTKIKLNKYEFDYLIKNIENHLNTIGETYQENEYVQELYKNLLNKNGKTKSKTDEKHSKTRRKTKKKNQS